MTSLPKLALYFAPGSSSMAVHIALHEVGAPFETHPMSFHKKDMRQPWYLAINPAGKVPTLMVDGRPLTEVAGCLLYLARKFPQASLLPKDDIEAEAQAVSWMSFIASTLHPARAKGLDHVMEVWSIAERKLGDRSWAIGTFSIADIHLFRLWWRVVNSLKPAREKFPGLYAHHDRVLARPAVQRTLQAESAIGYELPA